MNAAHAWMNARMPMAPMADEQSGDDHPEEDAQLRGAVHPGRVE